MFCQTQATQGEVEQLLPKYPLHRRLHLLLLEPEQIPAHFNNVHRLVLSSCRIDIHVAGQLLQLWWLVVQKGQTVSTLNPHLQFDDEAQVGIMRQISLH